MRVVSRYVGGVGVKGGGRKEGVVEFVSNFFVPVFVGIYVNA